MLRSKHFLSIFSSALIVGLVLFVSCADNPPSDDDQNSSDVQATTDDLKASADQAENSSKPGGDSGGDVPGQTPGGDGGGDNKDLGKDENPKVEASKEEAPPDNANSGANASADGGANGEAKPAGDLETNVDQSNKAVDETIASLESKSPDSPKPETNPEVPPEVPKDGEVPKADPALPPATPETTDPSAGLTNEPGASPVIEAPPTKTKHKAHKVRSASAPKGESDHAPLGKAPQIPGRAFTRGNQLLNRFYFVRAGDTPDKVASLIYGDASRAKDLKTWNKPGGKWAPGALIYYNAPNDPSDTSMKSFYQERNVPFEEYALSDGDSLPSIAKQRLGSRASWKELAVINGIDSPKKAAKGKKIAIYPADLSSYNVASIAPTQTAPTQTALSNGGNGHNGNNSGPSNSPETKTALNPPPPLDTVPKVSPSEENVPKAAKKPQGGLDIGKMVQQNIFFFGVGGMVIILLGCLAVFGRRKRDRSGDDFGDEIGSTPKTKRK